MWRLPQDSFGKAITADFIQWKVSLFEESDYVVFVAIAAQNFTDPMCRLIISRLFFGDKKFIARKERHIYSASRDYSNKRIHV